MEYTSKENNVEFFDQMASEWNKSVPNHAMTCIDRLVEHFNITSGRSILDVASGTGILLSRLRALQIHPRNYVAIDISSKMLNQLVLRFPGTRTYCLDFEKDVTLNESFDLVMIYNSIPHFQNVEAVFRNAYQNLNNNGKFIIAHSRTRAGLKEHHEKIGYVSLIDSIPSDRRLVQLSKKYHFQNVMLQDEEFFCYCGEKKRGEN